MEDGPEPVETQKAFVNVNPESIESSCLRKLLSRIHGRHVDEHEIEKATEDAEWKWIALKAENEKLRAEILKKIPGDYDQVCYERNTLKERLALASNLLKEQLDASYDLGTVDSKDTVGFITAFERLNKAITKAKGFLASGKNHER
jgi:hypothetical protein